MAAAAELMIMMKAKDQASKTIGGVGQKLGGLGKVAMMGAAAGGAVLVGLGVAALKMGADFDKAYDSIRVGTGKTGKEFEGLKEDFKAVFADIPTDMGKASQAIADFNTLTGASGKNLQDMSKNALEAARMLGEDATPIIKGVGQVMNTWKIPAEKGAELMDQLFVASQETGVGMGKLTQSLKVYGPVLKNMGFEMKDSIAFFGQMEKAGIDVSRIMPGLNAASRNWAKEGLNVNEMLRESIHEIKRAKTDTEALALATEVFGAEGAQRMSVAIRTGAVDLKDLVAKLGDSSGAILETAKDTESMGEKFTILKNKVMVAVEPIVSIIFDWASVMMDKLFPIIEKVSDVVWGFITYIKGVVTEGSALTDWLNDVPEEFQGIALAIGRVVEFGQRLIGFFQEGGASAGGLGSIISSELMPFIDEMSARWAAFVENIAPLIGPAFENVKAVFMAIVGFFQEHSDKVQAIFSGLWEIVKGIIKVAFSIIEGIVTAGLAVIAGDWDAAGQALKDMVGGIWEGIEQIIGGTLDTITGIVGLGWEAIKLVTVPVWESIKSAILGVWDGIKSGISSAIDWITDRINSFIEVVNKTIDALNVVPGVDISRISPIGGGEVEPYRGQGFQFGGIVPGPIGQPRLVMAHGGERIIPNDNRAVTMNIYGANSSSIVDRFQTDPRTREHFRPRARF